jgi:hypothetical protein
MIAYSRGKQQKVIGIEEDSDTSRNKIIINLKLVVVANCS